MMTEASPAVGEFVKMSKGQTLLSLVKERLALAAEDIFVLFERTIAEYEEELCRSKEENQRKRQLLDQLHRPTIQEVGEKVQIPSSSPGRGLNQEILETVQMKEEPEEQSVKQEEEQLPEPVPESSGVCVKTEESSLLQQRQTEHREGTQGEDISSETHFHSETETGHTELSPHTDNDQYWEPPFSCSTAQMETEDEGEHYNQVQTRDRSSKRSPQHYSTPETSVHRGDMSGAEGQVGMKFQCPFCQRRFGKKQDLERHVRVHTGEKPYTCSHCNQHFSHAFALSRHRRIHTGEKPYSCPVCKRTFANKHHLEKHKRSHTGEKPFSCSTCEKTFADKHVLNLHERTHTGDKPFSCSTCEKTFAHKRALYLHNRSHTGKNKKDWP